MLASCASQFRLRHITSRLATMAASAGVNKSLVFAEAGEPLKVLKLKVSPIPNPSDLKSGQFLVKILAAPINPSDINTVEGKYPLKPELPGVPGNEAVARVEAIGPDVEGIAVGDHVVPVRSCQGTWRQFAVADADAWHKVPSSLPVETACAMSINPPTALLMLRSFVELGPGDAVIQNGANSAVGRYVIQIARERQLKTINVVRPRKTEEETKALVDELTALGATLVTTVDALKADFKASGLPAPKLALDCVGGETATAIAKTLDHGGTMVTYGAMSKRAATVPPSLLIFKDLRFRGFWVSGAYAKDPHGASNKSGVVDEIVDLYERGVIKHAPVTKVAIEDWEKALASLENGRLNSKLVFSAEI